ncbi:MAG: type IV pilus secretin PilQ [Gammaproteobacteria bacterium]
MPGFGLQPAEDAAAGARTLDSIQTVALPGGKVEVDLKLSQPAPKPLSFSVNQPAMIVLDLPSTTPALAQSRRVVNVGDVTSVATASTQGKTRVVVNLASMQPYKARVRGNHVYVIVGGSSATVASASPSGAAVNPGARASGSTKAGQQTFGPASGVPSTPPATARAITNVSFHRTADGAGRVQIALSNSGIIGNVKREGSQVIVTFANTSVPATLQQRLEVTDFATPVTTVTTRQTPSGAQLVIQGSGEFEQLAYQADNTFAIELKPTTSAQLAAEGKKQYTGKKLTLNFQDIPVRAVLQILAQFTGKNIVVSGNVGGNVTLRLHDVPWDEALDIILNTQGLAMHKSGNVLLIAPAVQFARQESALQKAQSQVEQSAPLHTAYLQVNYAKASNLAALVEAKKNSLLSGRGSVTVDQRTNKLIVTDTDEHIAQVRNLVHTLDVPVRQVLIASRIVIASNNYERDLGARFGVTGVVTGDNSTTATTGNLNGTTTMLNGQQGGSPGPYPVPTDLTNRLNVNLPVATPAGQFAISILNSDFQVDLELSASQAEGTAKVVSSPRVITANQQKATITQGVEIPYQNASSSGATSVEFKKAVLSLGVTPQITPDNRILMALEVHDDDVGKYVSTANGGSVPSIDTRVVNTNVLVDNGDTVVIGGIYGTNVTTSVTKVPLLGDIPIIGLLFRNTQKVHNKSELLVFITPKVLASSLAQQ